MISRHAMLSFAVDYAIHGWPVFPLNGKNPFKGSHGVLDATTDVAVVAGWWCGRYAGCNIGGQIPESMIMIDIDPYHGGLDSLAALIRQHGPLTPTLTDLSGRGDGGAHYFYRRPAGRLSATRLGPGIDLKTHTGYGVLPPSLHPLTGQPYIRIEHPVAAPPDWLIALLRPAPPKITTPKPRRLSQFSGPSIADEFCANTSWTDILAPHGWRCIDADPDADGARWLHPTHTSACSATVRNGCLFVWSTSTVFDISEPGYPKGYTKFRAFAVLEHNGDMSAAARALSKGMA